MKANELRIGNIVQYMGQVTNVDDVIIFETCCNYAVSQPIPLTEEWLVKFGLQLNRWFRGSYKITKDDEFGFEMHVTSANFKHQVSFAYFKHVHQLQNLYFALTGIEL